MRLRSPRSGRASPVRSLRSGGPGRALVLAIVLGALAMHLGCATANDVMGAEPTPDSGFLESPEQMKDTQVAFQRGWVAPGFWFDQYRSIYVAPVDTTHLLAMSGWQKASIERSQVEDDAERLADEMREKFARALREYPDSGLEVADAPEDADLLLEMAIVQVVPSKAWLGAVGVASWGLGPVGFATGTAATTTNWHSLAFEGRIRRAASGEIVAQFADNQNAKTRVLDLQALTWYGHCHEIIDDWAEQFAAIANGPRDVQVQDESFFTLMPW